MLRNGVNVYDGGSLQQAPWLLTAFSFVNWDNFYLTRAIFLGFDLSIAAAIHKLTWRFVKACPFTAGQVTKCYFYNPFTFFAVFGMNLGMVTTLLQVNLLLLALQGGRELLTAFICGFLMHLDFNNFALLAPIAFATKYARYKIVLKCLTAWMIFTITSQFLLSSYWGIQDKRILFQITDSVYVSRMRIDSLRPNSGMLWYLFAQAFPAFTPLIKITFQMTLLSFWPACAVKFRRDPVFMFFMLLGSQMILKGYPSVADYALFFGLLMTQARLFERARVLFVALFVAAGVYVLKMQIWRYWIELPGFNANFYYIFTLIWNAVLIVIMMDVLAAYNKHQIYQENLKLKEKAYEKCKLFQR